MICRDRFRHWWRKPWRHTYHRYLDRLLLFFLMYLYVVRVLSICCLCILYNLNQTTTFSRLLLLCFLSLAFVRLHRPHLLRSCRWPHHSWSNPPRWCLWTSPSRDLLGYNAHWFWFVHIEISALSTLVGYDLSAYMCHLLYTASYAQFLCSMVCYRLPPPRFLGGQEG